MYPHVAQLETRRLLVERELALLAATLEDSERQGRHAGRRARSSFALLVRIAVGNGR